MKLYKETSQSVVKASTFLVVVCMLGGVVQSNRPELISPLVASDMSVVQKVEQTQEEQEEQEAPIIKQESMVIVISDVVPTPAPQPTPREYISQVFGSDYERAMKVQQCENGSMDPTAINWSNNNGTIDVGIWQHNVDPNNEEEIERLKDPIYNIDLAYQKYLDHNKTFYLWSCGGKAGDYTYIDYLRSL